MIEIIETKNIADNGMLLRMKIIRIIWPHKNTLYIRVIGDFIRTSKVPILCQWRTDLTSNKHCLPCSNWNKMKEFTEINNGHRVLLLYHGGVDKVHGGLLIPMIVTMDMNQVLTERSDLVNSIWNNFSGQDFLEFNWVVTDGSFIADSGLLSATGGGCKHKTNDVFRGAKVCTKWLQEKWWWIDIVWQQFENLDTKWKIQKSEKSTRGWQSTTRTPMTTYMIAWYSMTRKPMTTSKIAWHRTMHTPATTSTERRAHSLS